MVYGIYNTGSLEGVTQDESLAKRIVAERVQTVPCGKVAFAATEARARELLCS